MACLVDTNVISDITTEDPVWFEWSFRQICRQGRGLFVNPLIFAELCCHAKSIGEINALLAELRLGYSELPQEALYIAAQAFLHYKKQGGTKTAPLPDFFIGAHAKALGIPILTRDTSRYRTYFPGVPLICP